MLRRFSVRGAFISSERFEFGFKLRLKSPARRFCLLVPGMNGFSTEEDSHDGPPAPPFFGQSCCLIEDGERCGRAAGNASFSKRIQKSISQRKLKLDIDKSVSRLTSAETGPKKCVCLNKVSERR